MSDAGMLPKIYASEAEAVRPDAAKMLSIQRDLHRNSDIFNALINYLITMILGSEGAEILWRDDRKADLETLWRHFIDTADASCRGSFLQVEIWALTELLVTGEAFLMLNGDSTVSIVESERIKEVVYNKRGAIQNFLISNGDKETSIKSESCLFIALWKRPSAIRGTPLFSPCVDNVNVVSSIIRSVAASWHKQSKMALSLSTPGGTDDVDLKGMLAGQAQNQEKDGGNGETSGSAVDVMDLGEGTLYIGKGNISGITQTIPNATFSDSVESMIRIIASSAGLAGDNILNSFGNYSYSSARCSYMQTRGAIKRLQSQLIYSFYKPLIKWLLAKHGYENVDFDVILPAVPVLDDKADAEARERRLSLGLTTYEDELLSQNKSRFEHLQQKKNEVIDAIKIAKEIETETGYRVAYHQFCGLSQGKTEAAVVAGNELGENV